MTKPTTHSQDAQKSAQVKREQPKIDPAAERGERTETGKSIARGGKQDGEVEGATEHPKSGKAAKK